MSDPNTDNLHRRPTLRPATPEGSHRGDGDPRRRTHPGRQVANETAPDLTGLTAKTLTATHELALAWESPRRAHARRTAARDGRGIGTRQRHVHPAQDLYAPLAALFARAGKDFVRALTDLGGNVDVASVATSPTRAEA